MELWIRSQNKRVLEKTNNFTITKVDDEEYHIINNTFTIMGKYKTFERALEILDEIQKLLQPQTIINYKSKLEFYPEYAVQNVVIPIPKTEIKELSTYVYEMPKD